MNIITFLLVCCCMFIVCLAQSPHRMKRVPSWKRKPGSMSESKREHYKKKYKWSLKEYTNSTWTTLINNVQVSETARYKEGLNVIFMKSKDNILEDESLQYKKSFFIYDVDAGLAATSIGHGDYCFITEMDKTKTMDIVKNDLSNMDKTEASSPKPLSEVYVSRSDSRTTEQLINKSRMISAICSLAANCGRAYMTTLTQPQEAIGLTMRTSGLYNLYKISMTFNPEEEEKQCSPWHNYWMKFRNRKQ